MIPAIVSIRGHQKTGVSWTDCALSDGRSGKLEDQRRIRDELETMETRFNWRLHFATAYAQLDQLVQQKVVTGDSLRRILASLPVKELKSDRARIAIESATMLYDAVAGDKINLENQVYVLAAAEGIRNGLKAALQL